MSQDSIIHHQSQHHQNHLHYQQQQHQKSFFNSFNNVQPLQNMNIPNQQRHAFGQHQSHNNAHHQHNTANSNNFQFNFQQIQRNGQFGNENVLKPHCQQQQQQQQQQQHQTQFQPQNAFCFQPSSSFANNNGVKKHSFKSTASITNGKENRKQRLQQKRQQKRSQILSESRNQNSAFGWTLTVDMTPSGSRSSAKKKSGFPRHLR